MPVVPYHAPPTLSINLPFMEVEIYPSDRYALAQPRGRVTGDVIVDYGRAMAYHKEWEPGFTEVWDITFSESVDVLPTDIGRFKALEEETLELLRGSRTIVIVDRPLIRMPVELYARLMRPLGRDIVPVKTREEAAALLGVSHIPVLTHPV